MQIGKARIGKLAFMPLLAAVAAYGVFALLSIYVPAKPYTDCGRDTKELNGGEKVYAGHKFRIVLCGDGGDENFNHDKIRMQIFSESGELLAQRKFYVDWNGSGPFELKYGSGHITYFNDNKGAEFEHKVSMPPSRLDWIRARVPLMD